MAKRIRVLHVIQNLNYGGMERVLSDIVLRSDPATVESHVLCLQYLGRFAEGLDVAATLHVAAPMSAASMLRPTALARQIGAIAPDVVHSHSGVWYKASYAARIAGVPRVIHTEHGRARPDPLANRLVDSLGARRTDVVVAVSAPLASQLERDLAVPARKLAVIANGVDVDAYAPHADTGRLRAELEIAPTTPIIGSIGRLEPIKGYDIMVDAYAALCASGEDRGAVLVVGGEGSQRTTLVERVSALGLAGRVFLLGWRDDVLDMHSAFTLFTMSSRSEGTSISLLEAMSAGLAPVVTDVGGNAAVLGETLRHRLVPPEDPTLLARAWATLLADPAARAAESVIARDRVIEAFGLDAMVRAYARLYVDDMSSTGSWAGGQARSSA
jgi:glycosyltransferase involved in cell wall biosynthesis